MPKRFTLVALWALFAAAAVGVGFGASGLVGKPFTSTTAGGIGTADVTDSPTTASPSGSASSAAATVRSTNTPGGFVSASCSGDRVQVSATPATSWQLDDITTGLARTARVKFEPVGDSHGQKVTVVARCVDGSPAFTRAVRAARGGGDNGGGGDDGGGDDHGGGGGGGGGDGGGGHGGGDGSGGDG